ncbi:probable cytochrome P450 304a1 [Toxorhynchites rutilus septentrionalis]|uniref:probable cytochrome P450 304a1 n=1 Tax=Toxorhynchites rutilus septentrionalis TaxID=329112 RepID=UPI00247AB6B0|nr:probable cytochrome P450 304a1 [Toxorhynchites rutilus septentrionalis]
MVLITELIIGLLAGLLIYRAYRYLFERPSLNFPPGPPRLPLVGSYPFLLALNYRHLHQAAAKLSKLYGSKLIGLYLGPLPTVIVNDYETVKEVLGRADFDGRPDLFMARLRDEHFQRRGIFFTDGESWREQRKFFLKTLHQFGFGTRSPQVDADIQEGLEELIDLLRDGPKFEHEKLLMDEARFALCPNVFFALFSNVVLRMLIGARLAREDQGVLFEVGKNALAFHRNGDDYGMLLSYIPWIRHLFPEASKYNLLRKVNQQANEVILSLATKCEKSFDENDIRCFVDAYIKEIKRTNGGLSTGNDEFGFQYDQLVIGCADFLVPPLSAIPAKICLILERLMQYPQVQGRMYGELAEVIGTNRLVTLDDRVRLPYCEAVIREGLRIDTLVPSGIPHLSTKDTTLNGYHIPKGTVIVNLLDSIHHDQKFFKDAESFVPERFLNAEGRLAPDQDKSMPFGAGKRVCAGDQFARNALFLAVTSLVQNFTLQLPDGQTSPDIEARQTGVIRTTPDFRLRFTSRR